MGKEKGTEDRQVKWGGVSKCQIFSFCACMLRMKTTFSCHIVQIPENVTTTLKGCTVMVKGSRGSLWKVLNHINIEYDLLRKKKRRLWVEFKMSKQKGHCVKYLESLTECNERNYPGLQLYHRSLYLPPPLLTLFFFQSIMLFNRIDLLLTSKICLAENCICRIWMKILVLFIKPRKMN